MKSGEKENKMPFFSQVGRKQLEEKMREAEGRLKGNGGEMEGMREGNKDGYNKMKEEKKVKVKKGNKEIGERKEGRMDG